MSKDAYSYAMHGGGDRLGVVQAGKRERPRTVGLMSSYPYDFSDDAGNSMPRINQGAHQPDLLPSRFGSIQALRFIAAFAVVLCHCSFYTAERLSNIVNVYSPGANGVRLFFVISGFVMIVSSRKLEGTAFGWRSFAMRRIVRIVPIYWVAMAVKLAVLLASPGAVLHAKLDWSLIAKSLLFIPAINIDGDMQPFLGVGWTLNFEIFFYLLFAVVLWLRLGPTRTLAPLLVALALLSPVARDQDWPVPLQFWASPIVLDFLTGMVLARLVQKGLRLPRALAWLMIAAGMTYLFADFPRYWPERSLTGSAALTLASLAVVAGAVTLDHTLTKVIPRAILYLGSASYAVYLTHPIVAPIVPMVFNRLGLIYPLLSIALSVGVAVVCGILAYRFIEQPVTARLNGWARRLGLYETGVADKLPDGAERMVRKRID